MNDSLGDTRVMLYFIGLIAQTAFGMRFFIQWFTSERAGISLINPLFWKISLFGSVVMTLHSSIQLQFTPCFIQIINGIIAWRNLNLMNNKEKRASSTTLIALLICALPLALLPFILQGYFLFDGHFIWARTPISFANALSREQPLIWDLIGFTGSCLFASRFWVQCYFSELKQKSHLGASFWWLSLTGALLTISYFFRMRDLVNLIGPSLGLLPYVRNLMLMHKKPAKALNERA